MAAFGVPYGEISPLVILSDRRESKDLRTYGTFAVKSVRRSFDSLSFAQDDNRGGWLRNATKTSVIARGKAPWQSPGGMLRKPPNQRQAPVLIFGAFVVGSAYQEIATPLCGSQ